MAGPAPPLALVTGGRRGIGLAIARAFARAGHDVVVADLSVPRDGATLANDWGVDVRVECLVADVGDEVAVDALFADTVERFGRAPDVLVNNAAVQFWSSLIELSVADWETTLRVNLTGPFLMTKAFARARLDAPAAGAASASGEAADGGGRRGADRGASVDADRGASSRPGGAIVNIGSGCGRLAFPKLVSYTASKGGLEMLTKVSALELGPLGIRVNSVAPGAIETERTRAETDGYAEAWSPLTPLGRVGTVEDVADLVVALCGEGTRFVSGETIAVDGGVFAAAPWPRGY